MAYITVGSAGADYTNLHDAIDAAMNLAGDHTVDLITNITQHSGVPLLWGTAADNIHITCTHNQTESNPDNWYKVSRSGGTSAYAWLIRTKLNEILTALKNASIMG